MTWMQASDSQVWEIVQYLMHKKKKERKRKKEKEKEKLYKEFSAKKELIIYYT